MNRREFDQAFGGMAKALGVKVNRYQSDLFFEEFRKKDHRDLAAACRELSFGKQGWLPPITSFREYVVAAFEMRREKEKLDGIEDTQGSIRKVEFTSEDKLLSNRAAFEFYRQAAETKTTARNCFDREKVRLAQLDSSKDEEIFKRYGREGEQMPNPMKVFGNIGQGVVGE